MGLVDVINDLSIPNDQHNIHKPDLMKSSYNLKKGRKEQSCNVKKRQFWQGWGIHNSLFPVLLNDVINISVVKAHFVTTAHYVAIHTFCIRIFAHFVTIFCAYNTWIHLKLFGESLLVEHSQLLVNANAVDPATLV